MVLRSLTPARLRSAGALIRNAAAVGSSAARSGLAPLAKSMYVVPLAWAWAAHFGDKYDHVFSFWGHYPAICACLAHRFAGRPIPFSFQLHAGADLYFNKVYLRERLLYADSIVTVCEYNQRYLQEHFSDIYDVIAPKIHINYMGIDLKEFTYAPGPRHPCRITAVGRFVSTKGYDYLLRAIAEVARRGVAVELELIGDGEEAASLRALAHELGIADKVQFRGWLKADEVRHALREATVFVHPSSGLGDAKPNVVEEAMAVGAPVIASHVTGIPELLDHGACGILVPPQGCGRARRCHPEAPRGPHPSPDLGRTRSPPYRRDLGHVAKRAAARRSLPVGQTGGAKRTGQDRMRAKTARHRRFVRRCRAIVMLTSDRPPGCNVRKAGRLHQIWISCRTTNRHRRTCARHCPPWPDSSCRRRRSGPIPRSTRPTPHSTR